MPCVQVRHRGRTLILSPLLRPSSLQWGMQREQARRLREQRNGPGIRRLDTQLRPGQFLCLKPSSVGDKSQEGVMRTQEAMAIMQVILNVSAG